MPRSIRVLEEAQGIIAVKGAMVGRTTALDDRKSIFASIKGRCGHYLTKSADKTQWLGEWRKLKWTE